MAVAFESDVVRLEDGRVRTEVVTVVELSEELAAGSGILADCLENDFDSGPPVFGQQNFGEPSLADRLQNVVLFTQIHLCTRN